MFCHWSRPVPGGSPARNTSGGPVGVVLSIDAVPGQLVAPTATYLLMEFPPGLYTDWPVSVVYVPGTAHEEVVGLYTAGSVGTENTEQLTPPATPTFVTE